MVLQIFRNSLLIKAVFWTKINTLPVSCSRRKVGHPSIRSKLPENHLGKGKYCTPNHIKVINRNMASLEEEVKKCRAAVKEQVS